MYAPRPPLAGKRGSKAAAAGTCAANLRDLISHKTLSKRPLVSAAAGAHFGSCTACMVILCGREWQANPTQPQAALDTISQGTTRGNTVPQAHTLCIQVALGK